MKLISWSTDNWVDVPVLKNSLHPSSQKAFGEVLGDLLQINNYEWGITIDIVEY